MQSIKQLKELAAQDSRLVIIEEHDGDLIRVICTDGNNVLSEEAILPREPSWSVNAIIPRTSQVHNRSVLARVRETLSI